MRLNGHGRKMLSVCPPLAKGFLEWYLVSMAYNLLKLHHKAQTGRLGKHLVVPTVA